MQYYKLKKPSISVEAYKLLQYRNGYLGSERKSTENKTNKENSMSQLEITFLPFPPKISITTWPLYIYVSSPVSFFICKLRGCQNQAGMYYHISLIGLCKILTLVLGISSMLNGVNDVTLISVLIKIDFVQSTG